MATSSSVSTSLSNICASLRGILRSVVLFFISFITSVDADRCLGAKNLWEFKPDDEIMIVDLSSDVKFNGKRGKIIRRLNNQRMDEKDPYQRSLKTRYFLKLDDSEDIANIAAANLRSQFTECIICVRDSLLNYRYADDRKHRMLKEVCDEEQRSIRIPLFMQSLDKRVGFTEDISGQFLHSTEIAYTNLDCLTCATQPSKSVLPVKHLIDQISYWDTS
eukprot:jgi/Bigna1/74646/fgenesh1_pg.30_\